jgi:mannosyltransferase
LSLVICASRNEGFGLTCLEAMASGVPVVATRAGAWEMIIREGVDGYLVPCADSAALAAAVEQALSDPERLARMGRSALERARSDFSIAAEAASLNAHYRRILCRAGEAAQ